MGLFVCRPYGVGCVAKLWVLGRVISFGFKDFRY
jgi:hypothetical protein